MKSNSKFLIILLSFLYACGGGQKNEIPDSPTTGTVKLYCEEGFSLPMKNQIYTFEALYKYAHVNAKYVSEKEAVEGLFNDSCKLILISRRLSDEELKRFKAGNLYPRQTCVAKNALAVIVAREAVDSVLLVSQIKSLLSGEVTDKNIVFANENSGTATYLKDSLLGGIAFGKNCFAVKNTDELIKYVTENKNAIGILDYSWISDKDETIAQGILQKVRVLPIAAEAGKPAYYPDQSNIELKAYPFCRYMHLIRRSPDFSLGAGFIAFVAGQKGQLMMLKAGLDPAFPQERVVEINTAPLGQ
jgi:phosphate transport system substrate-binding protein